MNALFNFFRTNKKTPDDLWDFGDSMSSTWLFDIPSNNQPNNITQMPTANLIKFAFSFRVNGIRITLKAATMKEE